MGDRYVKCPRCDGSGLVFAWTELPTDYTPGCSEYFQCPRCHGSGEVDRDEAEQDAIGALCAALSTSGIPGFLRSDNGAGFFPADVVEKFKAQRCLRRAQRKAVGPQEFRPQHNDQEPREVYP